MECAADAHPSGEVGTVRCGGAVDVVGRWGGAGRPLIRSTTERGEKKKEEERKEEERLMWEIKDTRRCGGLKKEEENIKDSGNRLVKEAGHVGGDTGGEKQEGGVRRGDWKEKVGGCERKIQLDNVTVV